VTDEQRVALYVLACFTLLHGRPPGLGELAALLGISKPGACKRLRWLDKKGLVSRSDRAITEAGLRCALGSLPALTAPGGWASPRAVGALP
jgi:Mn-dependent DtxR family transcriptional regulator